MINKVIFILPNIYEITNGVSTKYIKFIHFLNHSNKFKEIIVITTFKNADSITLINKKDNINIIKTHGLIVPFYTEIKIPIITYSSIKKYISNNEIIIFNGEFIWMYNILIKLKKKYKDIKLYPTMHTDYIFYANQIYSLYNFSSTLNYLDHYLDNKQFSGIIVTGDKMVEKYSKFTNSIFNANEINLEIFNNHKIDKYHKSTNTTYNFIYTGRISKEKNILEIFECCMILLKCDKKYNFILNIIGEGPYLNNIKSLLELEYKELNDIVIFHGNKNHNQLFDLYHKLDNRIFIFTSISETFGKTPMEAGATGIPIFIKKSENTDNLYIHKDNAIIFNDKNDFLQLFEYFINLNDFEKRILISNSINNIKKYDQKIIFEEWLEFILNGKILKDKAKLNIFNIFTFHGLSKFINCSGTILGD